MKTVLLPAAEGVESAVAALEAGLPVALPTETVYGLAADAFHPEACARIFEAKERPLDDPLIVHVADAADLGRVAEVTPLALHLAERFWPGPLTLVLPRTGAIPDLVTSGQSTVAVRCSAHPDFRTVCRTFGKPLAAPSANRFGRISPTTAEAVREELEGRIPLILDGGPCRHGIESTIVHVHGEQLSILRSGPVTLEELTEFGSVVPAVRGVSAPGRLASHYAPRTPLELIDAPSAIPAAERATTALLLPDPRPDGVGFRAVEILSKTGDLREMAARLFGAMRRLDGLGPVKIAAVLPQEIGIGVAIAERLRKAASHE